MARTHERTDLVDLCTIGLVTSATPRLVDLARVAQLAGCAASAAKVGGREQRNGHDVLAWFAILPVCAFSERAGEIDLRCRVKKERAWQLFVRNF